MEKDIHSRQYTHLKATRRSWVE